MATLFMLFEFVALDKDRFNSVASMARIELPTNKTTAWKRLRYLQRWNRFLILGFIPGVILFSLLLGLIAKQLFDQNLSFLVIGIPWAIAIIVSNAFLYTCPCPQCSGPFFVKNITFWHGFFFTRRNCINCGSNETT